MSSCRYKKYALTLENSITMELQRKRKKCVSTIRTYCTCKKECRDCQLFYFLATAAFLGRSFFTGLREKNGFIYSSMIKGMDMLLKKLRSVIVSQNCYLIKILDIHPLTYHIMRILVVT